MGIFWVGILRGNSPEGGLMGGNLPSGNFPGRSFPDALKSMKVQGIFGETFILTLLSAAVFHLQNCVSDFF